MLRFFRSSILERVIKSNLNLLLLSDKIIQTFKFLLPYEEDWLFFKEFSIPKKSTIIDIGAHWGESAITFRKFYPQNKIMSFEPNLYAFQKLKKNTRKLDIQIFNYGISKKKTNNLYFPYYKNHQLSLWGAQNLKNLKRRVKEYTYLDNKNIGFRMLKCHFNKMPKIKDKISIIKIDVEGEEFVVIKEIDNLIIKHKPLLFIEHNKNNFGKTFKFLKKRKYKAFYYNSKNLIEIKKENDMKPLLEIKEKRTINLIFKNDFSK